MYAVPWFITICAYALPLDCCGLLWDRIILGHGMVELFRFLLAWLLDMQVRLCLPSRSTKAVVCPQLTL